MTDAQTAQNIATTYDPTEIEKKWYKTWEEQGYFKPSGHGESFCIMIPPPNVTGSLHSMALTMPLWMPSPVITV